MERTSSSTNPDLYLVYGGLIHEAFNGQAFARLNRTVAPIIDSGISSAHFFIEVKDLSLQEAEQDARAINAAQSYPYYLAQLALRNNPDGNATEDLERVVSFFRDSTAEQIFRSGNSGGDYDFRKASFVQTIRDQVPESQILYEGHTPEDLAEINYYAALQAQSGERADALLYARFYAKGIEAYSDMGIYRQVSARKRDQSSAGRLSELISGLKPEQKPALVMVIGGGAHGSMIDRVIIPHKLKTILTCDIGPYAQSIAHQNSETMDCGLRPLPRMVGLDLYIIQTRHAYIDHLITTGRGEAVINGFEDINQQINEIAQTLKDDEIKNALLANTDKALLDTLILADRRRRIQ